MKRNRFLNTYLVLLYTIILFCDSCSFSKSPERSQKIGKAELEIKFASPYSTFLYGKQMKYQEGNLEIVSGDYIPWKGNASVTWEKDIYLADEYEVYLIANVGSGGEGTRLTIKTREGSKSFTLHTTKGPFQGGDNFQIKAPKNFQRIKLKGTMPLQAGKQEFVLSTRGYNNESVLFDFRSVEFLPVSKKQEIFETEQRAENARANVEWLREKGYGLMFHWTSQSVQPDGSCLAYEDAVNKFNVAKFTRMVEETGAGYVFFTIGHAESYCPAPLESWEQIHPGHTCKRDLIKEIASSLEKKGISFLCYINGPLGFRFPENPTKENISVFTRNYKDILVEMGNRYGKLISGYWFDSWYRIFEKYKEFPFEEFSRLARTGNEDRIICLNPWIYPDVSPWQDYWSGEVQSPIGLPENGFMVDGPSPDLPYQVLLTMEKYLWVQKRSGIDDPKYTSDQLSEYIRNCMSNKGFVTINMAIYQNGTVGGKALQIMREVKDNIRTN